MARVKSEYPRGYKVEVVSRVLTIDKVATPTDVYLVSSKKFPTVKTFVSKEKALRYINECEVQKVTTKALDLSGYQHVSGVVAAHNDIMASTELAEAAELVGI